MGKIGDWRDASEARRLIVEAINRYQNTPSA